MTTSPVNILQWIDDNKQDFKPPVCNKLLYKDQLKVMCIGGSNVRSDYHLEEGEELFYQFKGEMCLKVVEHGKPKDIPIKEGEIFILPSYIPHSPQRPPGTIGLVIERERLSNEMDGLRFYTDTTNQQVLFERWFHCTDLGTQLKPVINQFFESEAYKTGKPTNDSIQEPAFDIDIKTSLDKPQLLTDLISNNLTNSSASLYDKGECKVNVFGEINIDNIKRDVETWFWQHKGIANIEINNTIITLKENDVFIIPANTLYSIKREKDSIGLEVIMDPKYNPNRQN